MAEILSCALPFVRSRRVAYATPKEGGDMTIDNPAPPTMPKASFNFASHLMDINRERPNKTAYIDDHGSMSYSELRDGIQRMAAALQKL